LRWNLLLHLQEDHQGRIWARNQPGRGAVFALALPLL